MEPVFFSLEEAMPEPDSNPCRTASPPLEAHVLAGGLGGVGAGKVVGGGATNECATEWCFHESVDEPWLLNVPTAPVANPEASTLYPNPTAEGSRKRPYDVHEMVGAVEVIPTPPAASPEVDPVAYNAMLRRKLDAHLAAVAMLRNTQGICRQSSHDNGASQNPDSIQGSENHTEDVSVHQLSSSSLEPSPSDGDMEGEAQTIGTMHISAEKANKRKESNRDSARRSRSRKAAHTKELEEQVSLLRVANNSLIRHLADVSQRYINISIDNRVLKANVETLEAKVKMAEETMKRVTCTNNFPQAISGTSLRIPFSGSPLDGICDNPLPTQNTSLSYLPTTTTDFAVKNNYIPEPAPAFQIHDQMSSLHMQPMSCLDHHPQMMHIGIPTSTPTPQRESTTLDSNEIVNMMM
ncbi:bZIP transcription factor RISBZ1 isoform X1 [Triticum aestivum]|uniref:bZIP transcription factor RISBZ1 isoform X1 n=1 Tax=Triticum aestivum TaxID=4565 RepID=UPI001D012DA2|nr:bZIP transcription factor RISBZ1-like isoform X1 [Triticum aestivum]XP_044444809.1 bZIP transcription factor RISBZ1-like isoform X1 [Triticum aestivum]